MYGSRANIRQAIEAVRASYWFIPATLVLLSIGMSELTQWIDRNPDIMPFDVAQSMINTKADGARSTMAVIAQSIIGVTGVMFSITMVAVSFASGQFGPRLIGNFMRDRGNQWSLGVLIATFVYSLLILGAIHNEGSNGAETFVPQYSILVALTMTLLSVAMLIYYVHHVPETINVSNISATLGKRFSEDIRIQIDRDPGSHDTGRHPRPHHSVSTPIKPAASGYVQNMDFGTLSTMAKDNDWTIDIGSDVGGFVNLHHPICIVHSGEELDENTIARVQSNMAIGDQRSETQDVIFLVDQLVEMIGRALSPGINDPFTAINCLNWLEAGLSDALNYNGGLHPVKFERINYRSLDFDQLVDSGLVASAPYCRDDPLARSRWRKCVDRLTVLAEEAGNAPALERLGGLERP